MENASHETACRWRPAACGIVALLCVAGGALAFRLVELDLRPVHHDEANQILKCARLLQKGYYRYDPHQHHGPTLYYLTLPSAWLTSGTDFASTVIETYRIVPVIFGAGLVLLLYLVRDGMGWTGALCSGVFTALSPAMVYYNQFYIQETLLVFFTFGAVAAGWRYARTGRAGWAVATGVLLALMHATKETCVLAFAAMALALLVAAWSVGQGRKVLSAAAWKPRHVAMAVGAGLVVWAVFFSSFFTNPAGLADSIRAYWTYLHRAGGDGVHDHPWHYYLRIFTYAGRGRLPAWTDTVVVGLAGVGLAAAALKRAWTPERKQFARFAAVYAVVLFVIYSAIPYKTPWSGLSCLHGLILLAGIGAAALVDLSAMKTFKAGMYLLLAAGAVILARQSYRANFIFHSLARNPYAYAQTSTNFEDMVQRIEDIAELHPDGRDMLIRVVARYQNTWPLPWYLRRFTNVVHSTGVEKVTGPVDAPLIVTSQQQEESLQPRLQDEYQREFYGIRPEVLMRLYIRKDLWDAFLKTRM